MPSDALSAVFLTDEQILKIDAGTSEPCGKIIEEERKADGCFTVPREDDAGDLFLKQPFAVKLLGGLWVNVVYWFCRWYMDIRSVFQPEEAYSIGIIGGADGPTAIFLTSPPWMHYILPVLMLTIGLWGFLRLRKCKQR